MSLKESCHQPSLSSAPIHPERSGRRPLGRTQAAVPSLRPQSIPPGDLPMSMRHSSKALLMTFGAVLALSACGGGADRVASPGEGAFPPPPPTSPPPPSPPPSDPPPSDPPPSEGPAASCPTGFQNIGIVGELRACELPERI